MPAASSALFIVFVIAFLSVEDLARTGATPFLGYILLNIAVIVMGRARMQGYPLSFRIPCAPAIDV